MSSAGEGENCRTDDNSERSEKEVPSDSEGRKPQKLRRYDSLDVESAKVQGHHGHGFQAASWAAILQLAFQSVGVVYGDIGTSPLYVYSSAFSDGIKHRDDIVGVLSLIYYTLTLLPLVKYVFIVLRANDNGKGGTFALYSLLCRHAKVGLIPSQQAEDREVSNYRLELPNTRLGCSSTVKSALEGSRAAKFVLLLLTMLATSLVIGDGILTPCISVLSAVGGIKEATPVMTEERVVWISVGILVFLFSVQRFGTDKVGYSFAPIICIWFSLNAGIGLYNFTRYDPTVIKAVNPWHIVDYFRRNGKDAWVSLGGVVLCITGTEALFADLGHFTVRSIQISTCTVTYPALILAYSGQASYLRKNPWDVSNAFFKSVPAPVYWPVFAVAVLAAIIASQAMISGTFSILQQSLSLGCFPRVKVVHTSAKYEGQVYIPEVNFILMLACVCVTVGFKTTQKIGNAYGIAVVFAETITSSFMVLVMILIWKKHILLVITYVVFIMSVEVTYLSSVLYKFPHGGYLPIAFATVSMTIMYIWNYTYRKKYYYEMDHKVSPDQLREIAAQTNLYRVPGLAIFYSELVHGIPPIFEHYAANIPALHSVLVFVSFKSLPISNIPPEERFLFRRVQPRELCIFRCIIRYGYTDARGDEEPFERTLAERLKEFMREELWMDPSSRQQQIMTDGVEKEAEGSEDGIKNGVETNDRGEGMNHEEVEKGIEVLDKAWSAGVVHLMGENEVVAAKGSGIGKKILINYGYSFLKKNLRQSDKVLDIPHKRLLKVGMTYEL
ncbi:hypothetical protein Nepgr_027831 [Nepenthes gracilis]|uniref:Potassium transporter n=1 Tax=Nepenthes gracilis TaxID=150966 RepID=A0AAD3TB89_NEPGR|nr:hypothetical protein Nepgr_027831 [Nepenthes gracilis]